MERGTGNRRRGEGGGGTGKAEMAKLVNDDGDEGILLDKQKTWMPRMPPPEEVAYDAERGSTWKPSQRKAAVRESAKYGDVDTALKVLEAALDPEEAKGLARYARETAKRHEQHGFLDGMKESLGLGWGMSPGGKDIRDYGLSEKEYDPLTCQIKTGKVASVILEVIRGRDLPVMDGATGECDPFVVIQVSTPSTVPDQQEDLSREYRTGIQGRTRNPVWNDSFDIPIDQAESTLRLEVRDWDEDGTHELIGHIRVPMEAQVRDLVEQLSEVFEHNKREVASAHKVLDRTGLKRDIRATARSDIKLGSEVEAVRPRHQWLPIEKYDYAGRSVGQGEVRPHKRPEAVHAGWCRRFFEFWTVIASCASSSVLALVLSV